MNSLFKNSYPLNIAQNYSSKITKTEQDQNTSMYRTGLQLNFGKRLRLSKKLNTPDTLFINAPGFNKNMEWAEKMYKDVETAAKNIELKILTTAYSVLDYLSEGYYAYVKHGKWKPHNFKRNFAPVDGRNISQESALRRKMFIGKLREIMKEHENELVNKPYLLLGEPGKKITGKSIKVYYPKENGIEVTGIASVEHEKNTPKHPNYRIGWYYVSQKTWRKKILPIVEGLFSEILNSKGKINNQQNLDEAVEKVSKTHWWTIHGMPFIGGTAGITDKFVKTLFKFLNIDVSCYKKNVIPDMIALSSNLQDFTKQYPSFFEAPFNFKSASPFKVLKFAKNNNEIERVKEIIRQSQNEISAAFAA